MRKRLYDVLSQADDGDRVSRVYGTAMTVVILLSLVPLLFKEEHAALQVLDAACAVVFIVDYALRWATADYKYGRRSPSSFLRYPFSPWAIVDLLSILPSLTALNGGFKVLRLGRALRVLRVFKAFRYSKNFDILLRVLRRSKEPLAAVCSLAVSYILVSALVVFSVEPDTFGTFFDAVYWATVSLTTVGYGDIYPVTVAGRVVTMISSVVGIAIVALPAGIVTAGYMEEINSDD